MKKEPISNNHIKFNLKKSIQLNDTIGLKRTLKHPIITNVQLSRDELHKKKKKVLNSWNNKTVNYNISLIIIPKMFQGDNNVNSLDKILMMQ